MKKIILTTLSVLGTLYISSAQDLKLGVKAGLNFTTLKSNDKWFASESKAGYQAGVWGRIGSQKYHFQPEAYFTSKTASVHPEIQDAPSDFYKGNIKFTNIDVPLLIGTRFPLGPIKAKLQAGPLFSFVINENNPYGENIKKSYQEALTNYKSKFSSLVIGTGVDVLKFAIDLRYEYGLGNISKYEGQKQKMNLWTVSVGYSLF